MSNMEVFMHAERIQESGDNYNARNSASGASGAYQFTWGTWLEALAIAGLRYAPYNRESANHAPHWVQDAAAKALMTEYYNMFNHSFHNVAEAWYGGPGAVGHPGWGGGPGYPTVGQYADQVMAIYRRLGGKGGGGSGGGGGAYVNVAAPALVRHYEFVNSELRHAIANNIGWIKYSSQLKP